MQDGLTGNAWKANAVLLADAYVRHAHPLHFALTTRALREHIGEAPLHVLDVGGGFGEQALSLARLGHRVDVVDCDPNMLSVAWGRMLKAGKSVAERVRLIEGDCENLRDHVDREYDLVCCHSVLAYLPRIDHVLAALVQQTAAGGWISIVNRDPASAAVRFGLQHRWQEALDTLDGAAADDPSVLPDFDHDREIVVERLDALGCELAAWHGLGLFSEHAPMPETPEETALMADFEYRACARDPFRSVARAYHLIFRKHGG